VKKARSRIVSFVKKEKSVNSWDKIAEKISDHTEIHADYVKAWLRSDWTRYDIRAIEDQIYNFLSLSDDEDALVHLSTLGVISDFDLFWLST
jgi:hypothetical protein